LFYRVNLALPEARLSAIRHIQEAPVQELDEIYDIPTRPDYFLVTQTVNAYPDQIGRVLKAAGPILDGNEYFILIPALVCEQRTRHNKLIPQSERVVLSNLRETVVALADPETN
jgi:hypothetical protein